MAALLLNGCGNAVSSDAAIVDDSNVDEAVSAQTVEYKIISPEMYEQADMWASCDDSRLAAVMKKAQSKEKVVIACIGGSITQGVVSSGSKDKELLDSKVIEAKKPYADYYFEWWENSFPDTEFEFINAGIGGTSSYYGVHRVEEEVLKYNPDLVLVEFAVNDGADNFYQRSYDNLVRRILKSRNDCACIMLFMEQTNGISAQKNEVLIGFNYKVPMISYANAIEYCMDNKIYTDKDLAGDGVHPSALGHLLCGELLSQYLDNVNLTMDSYEEPKDFSDSPVTKECYMDASRVKLEDCGQILEDGTIEATATFSRLGLAFNRTADGKSGAVDVYVDGQHVMKVDADFKNGWGAYIDSKEVYASDEYKEHTIELKKCDDSLDKEFKLEYFLIN